MIWQMILRNLVHRPLRTAVSVLAVAVEVTLVIVIVGLTSGMLEETAKRIEGVGADIMVQPPSASVLLAFSGAPMPITIGNRLEQARYVQAVAPVLLQFNANGVEMVYGIEPESFRAVSNGFVFLAGKDMSGPDDMLIDDWEARSKDLKAGDTYRLLDHDFHVSGVVEHGKGSRMFVNLATLQDLSGAREKASLFFLEMHTARPYRSCHGRDSLNPAALRDPAAQGFSFADDVDDHSGPRRIRDQHDRSGRRHRIPGDFPFDVQHGDRADARHRRTEIDGASQSYITRALLGETSMICAGGIVLGIASSFLTRQAFETALPTLSIIITPEWIVRAALISLARRPAGRELSGMAGEP